MLPLEQQTVSIDLAKKMKELGFEQDSLFYLCTNDLEKKDDCYEIAPADKQNGFYYAKEYSAYTASQLGEALPATIVVDDTGFFYK